MSIKITAEGLQVEVSSVAEAAELIRALRAAEKPPEREMKVIPDHSQVRPNGYVPPAGALDSALNFLDFLRKTAPLGASTEQVMGPLGAAHAKGVGGRLAIVNRLLDEVTGFAAEDIYSNDKGPDGRVWKPLAKTEVAAARLHSFADAHPEYLL